MARPVKFEDTEVLDRATELFWKYGCDSVSIRDLEQGLDLRAPSIYRRFQSKDRLVACCVDRYVKRVVGGRIRRLLDGADDPVEGLRSFFTSVLDPHPGERHPRGCLLTVTAGQATFQTPAVRSAVTAGFDTIEAALRSQLERARTARQLSDHPDIDMLAKGLLVSFEGLLVLARSGSDGLETSIDAIFAGLATST